MKYAIGVDFGTESGRALLVEVGTGREVATAVYPYANGVIDEKLPETGVALASDWALQDPEDYLRTFQVAIPGVLKDAGVSPEDVIGLGIDFTACTMLPVRSDGTPLCTVAPWRGEPHAWVKLWKHHAAQPEADQINRVARETGQAWLDRYGGKISSEWFFSKALQILTEAPEVYAAADRLIEAADWVVWQLTGIETRNSCTAGYKAMWSKREGFPPAAYFQALHPAFASVVDGKMSRDIRPVGERAGGLTPQAAAWTGLLPGTAVAIANVDAHVAVPAATVTDVGRMVMIMGTSICHMVLGREEHIVPGMCGCVEDGIIPGFFGYEAGQSCVGITSPGRRDLPSGVVRAGGARPRARCPPAPQGRLAAGCRRVGPHRSGLVERQPPVRTPTDGPRGQRQPGDHAGGDLPGLIEPPPSGRVK
jgi:L-ribulokinase